jgi:hypothetical protein
MTTTTQTIETLNAITSAYTAFASYAELLGACRRDNYCPTLRTETKLRRNASAASREERASLRALAAELEQDGVRVFRA